MNVKRGYHVKIHEIEAPNNILFLYNFDSNNFFIATTDEPIKNYFVKVSPQSAFAMGQEKETYYFLFEMSRLQEICEYLKRYNYLIVSEGTVYHFLKSCGLGVVRMSAWAVLNLLGLDKNFSSKEIAYILDEIVNRLEQNYTVSDKTFSKKIVVFQYDKNINALKTVSNFDESKVINLEYKGFCVYATYEDLEGIDNYMVFDNFADFFQWCVQNDLDLKAVKKFLNNEFYADFFPIGFSDNENIIEYYKAEYDIVQKTIQYARMLFPFADLTYARRDFVLYFTSILKGLMSGQSDVSYILELEKNYIKRVEREVSGKGVKKIKWNELFMLADKFLEFLMLNKEKLQLVKQKLLSGIENLIANYDQSINNRHHKNFYNYVVLLRDTIQGNHIENPYLIYLKDFIMEHEDLFLINVSREQKESLIGNQTKIEFVNKLFKDREKNIILLPYAILFISKAFYGKSYHELSIDYSRKGRKISVFIDKNNRTFFEYFYEEYKNAKSNQHVLYLGILLYIISLIKSNSEAQSDLGIKISHEFVVTLSRSCIELIKDKLNYYTFTKLDYDYVVEYHEKAKKANGFYNITSKFADFVRDKFTLFNLSIFPHQERAVNKIYEAYLSEEKDGFILAHATGSGKTVTISESLNKIIEYRKSFGLETKVLFISKAEILDKIAEEFVYFVQDGIIFNARTGKDLEEIVRKGKYPKYLGISFKLFTDFLSEEPQLKADEYIEGDLQGTQEEGLIETADHLNVNIEEDDSDEEIYIPSAFESDVRKSIMRKRKLLKAKPNIGVNVEMVIELFEKYDIIVVDEAHYIKGGTVANIDTINEKNVKCNSFYGYPDIRQYGYCYTSKPSKLFAILLFVYLRYLNNIKEAGAVPVHKKKFFLTVSGTIMANNPHDAWILMFMTGLSRNKSGNVRNVQSVVDSYSLAQSAGGEVKGSVIEYSFYKKALYQLLVSNVKNHGNYGNLDAILSSFASSANAEGYNFDLKDTITDAVSAGYIDIYTEKDAIKDGVLVDPRRTNIEIKVFDNTHQSSREALRYINDNIDIVADIEFFKNIKQYYSMFNKSKNKSNRLPRIVFKEENYLYELNSILNEERYKNLIEYSYRFLNQVRLVKNAENEIGMDLYRSILHLAMTGNEFYINIGDDKIEVPGDTSIIHNDKKKIFSIRVAKLIDSLSDFINYCLLNSRNLNKFYSLTKIVEALSYMMFDIIRIWIETDMGVRKGNGKGFVVTNYVYVSKIVGYMFLEFFYNIYKAIKEDKAVDIVSLIKNIALESQLNIVGFNILSNTSMSVSEEFYMAFIEALKIIVEDLYSVFNMISSEFALSAGTFNNINHLMIRINMIKRIFVLNQSIASHYSKNESDVERILEDYIINKLYSKYGKDIFEVGARYVNIYAGNIKVARPRDFEQVLNQVSFEKINIINNSFNLLDYLVKINMLNHRTYEYLQNKINVIKGKIETIFQSKHFAYVLGEDYTSKDIFKITSTTGEVKMAISKNFLENPDLRIVVANIKAMAEGLNFSGGSFMYIIEMNSSIGLLSQVEARINRFGNISDIDICYITSDFAKEHEKVEKIIYKDIVNTYLLGEGKNIFLAMIKPIEIVVEEELKIGNVKMILNSIKEKESKKQRNISFKFETKDTKNSLFIYAYKEHENDLSIEEYVHDSMSEKSAENMHNASDILRKEKEDKDVVTIDIDTIDLSI